MKNYDSYIPQPMPMINILRNAVIQIRTGYRNRWRAIPKTKSAKTEQREDPLAKNAEECSPMVAEIYKIARVHALLEPYGLVNIDGVVYAARWQDTNPSPAIGDLVHVVEDEAKQHSYIAYFTADPLSYDQGSNDLQIDTA
jgi:hypothetical protein